MSLTALLLGLFASLPVGAQQTSQMRRIGVLMGLPESDPQAQARIAAFRKGLQTLGWEEGRNVRIDTRWATTSDAPAMQRFAKELVALQHPTTAPYADHYLSSFKTAAASLAIEVIPAPVRNTSRLESAIAAQARTPNGGLIVMTDSFLVTHRAEITALAARYRVPAVYPFRDFIDAGGLLFYGNDLLDSFRRAATYADRILKGATPNELPVQTPVKFELVINVKTAKALGLTIPSSLLFRADQVVE